MQNLSVGSIFLDDETPNSREHSMSPIPTPLPHYSFVRVEPSLYHFCQIARVPSSPPTEFIFEVVGSIIAEDCFMTTHGNSELTNPTNFNQQAEASCWLQASAGSVSSFRKMLRRVRQIAETASFVVDTSGLYRRGDGLLPSYFKVVWALYDSNGVCVNI